MAINVNPLAWYQDWNNVLPMLGIQYRESDDSQPGWFYQNPEEGSGRIHWGEDGPADPNLQYAPARLYEEALRQQGYVPISLGDLGYYAQYGQYGDGQGFGGDVSKYLDYVYGAGWQTVNDPTHGFLIKPSDPAKAINGAGTPVALPDRSGSFGDFLKEGAGVIAPLAIAAFAGPLAQSLGGGMLGSMGAGSVINGGLAAISGGDPLKGAITGAVSGGVGSALPSVGVTDPTLGGAIRGGVASTLSGGDPLRGALSGAAFSGLNQLGGSTPSFTLTADGGNGPASMPVSVNPVDSGNAFLNSLVAQNQGTYAGADSITGGGPTTPAPASWTSGLNNPFQFIPSVAPQEKKNEGEKMAFFGDILDPFEVDGTYTDSGINPLSDVQQWADGVGALNADGSINWDLIDQTDPWGLGSTDGAPVVPDAAWGMSGSNLLKALYGAIVGGRDSGGLLGRGGVLGTGLDVGRAAAIAPALAAIAYAQNQSPFDTSNLSTLAAQVPTSFSSDTSGVQSVMDSIPTNTTFDTSRLTSTYDQFDPNSVTGQYDLNTAAARNALTGSLQSRGLMGSSFATSDIANFNQARDVGRQTLINDALTRRAGIASDILANDRAAAGLNLQGIGMRGNLATNLLDNKARNATLGLQGQSLRRGIMSDVLGAQIKQQENKNKLYGSALAALAGGLSPATRQIWS